MMKKVWLVLLAVVLVFGLAMLGCGSKKSGTNEPDPGGDGDGDLVETVVFEMITDSRIQGLTAGLLTIADTDSGANPIDPLVKAGNNTEHVTGWQAVDIGTGGNKQIALQYTTGATWGVGVDLRYAKFGFIAGDKITVTGEVVSGGPGDVHLNGKLGGTPVLINESVKYDGAIGPFTLSGTLSATDITNIKGSSPATIRIEARASGMTMKITNIKIVGMRPATVVQLGKPVVTATDNGVSWTAVDNATGYKVYVGDATTPIATVTGTSINLNALDALDPGTYSITVVAIGSTGYSDSEKSAAVSYTKPAPVVINLTIKVGGTDKTVALKAVSGEIVLLEGGKGYTFTKGADYQGSYVYFNLDLGSEKLKDYEKVTIKYKPTAPETGGDFNYKNLGLIASETALSGELAYQTLVINEKRLNNYSGGGSWDFGPQTNNTMDEQAFTLQINGDTDLAEKSNLYFSIYPHLPNELAYTISDIVFEKGTAGARKLTSITVKTQPTTASQAVGTEFDPAGLVITLNYSNGATVDQTYAKGASDDANPSTWKLYTFANSATGDFVAKYTPAAASETIYVKYLDKTAALTTTITAAP
jgi:hypothetical protein